MQMVASIQRTQVCVYWHFTAAMITAYPFILKHESDSRKYVIFQQTCMQGVCVLFLMKVKLG